MTRDTRFLRWTAGTVVPRRVSAFVRLLAVGLLCAGLAGCGADFDPPTLLSKLRLLALQAEPVNPAQGQATAITPLVYSTSSVSEALDWSWSWCPLLGQPNDGYLCPISYDDASALLAAAGVTAPVPAFELGADPTASLTNPFPPQLLAALCADGFDGQPIDCTNGFPIRVSVRVSQGAGTQLGTTVVRLPVTDSSVSNANPVPGALSVDLASGTAALDDLGSVQVPRLEDNALHVALDDSQAETYPGTDPGGGAVTVRETLLVSWFAELGDFHDARTLFIDGVESLSDATTDTWKPPAVREDARPTARLIVVVRDDRGGVGWSSATASLEPTP